MSGKETQLTLGIRLWLLCPLLLLSYYFPPFPLFFHRVLNFLDLSCEGIFVKAWAFFKQKKVGSLAALALCVL